MGPWLTGFLLGVGVGVWTWNKSMKETSRQDTSLILGGVIGAIVFVVIGSFLKFIVHF